MLDIDFDTESLNFEINLFNYVIPRDKFMKKTKNIIKLKSFRLKFGFHANSSNSVEIDNSEVSSNSADDLLKPKLKSILKNRNENFDIEFQSMKRMDSIETESQNSSINTFY